MPYPKPLTGGWAWSDEPSRKRQRFDKQKTNKTNKKKRISNYGKSQVI